MAKARIRNRIKELRAQHGRMTQQELADQVGCTRQTIIVLEQERYVPSLSLAFRIAAAFDSTVVDVFEYVEEK